MPQMERVVGGQCFKSKGDLETYIRRLVDRYPDGVALSAVDHEFMVTVFEGHRDWNRKCVCGVAEITLAPPPDYPHQRCFWLRRADGTVTDIS